MKDTKSYYPKKLLKKQRARFLRNIRMRNFLAQYGWIILILIALYELLTILWRH